MENDNINKHEAISRTLTVQAVLYGEARRKFDAYKRETQKKNQDIIFECVNGYLSDY